jgi:uncharacterized protein (UPF0210 family)
MALSPEEILQTTHMFRLDSLDVRTVTLGVSLRDCSHPRLSEVCSRVYEKLMRTGKGLVPACQEIEGKYGIPIVNKRISVTPISLVAESCEEENYTPLALTLDRVAKELGIDFIGGFSALVPKGFTRGDERLFKSLPEALSSTERLCASVSVGSTKAGINMDAVLKLGFILKEMAERSKEKAGMACTKFVVFMNPVEDNPFMAGAFHGLGEGEHSISIGVSGPGVVRHVISRLSPRASLSELADEIKKIAFKITRMGEFVGREVSKILGYPFNIVDLSLAPTPAVGDSVAEILEAMGLERVGTHGTVAALALLNDAVKKGGAMATNHVGGLSGAFIPVSEDQGMIRAAQEGALSLDKLESMTAVCSVGIDMVAIPGDTPAETISAIIADEMAIGLINCKTTAVRILPVPGKTVGEMVHYGGLLGSAPIMRVHPYSSSLFIRRGGQFPAPLQSFNN